MTWEYKVVSSKELTEEILEEHGLHNWELVVQKNNRLIFKRKKLRRYTLISDSIYNCVKSGDVFRPKYSDGPFMSVNAWKESGRKFSIAEFLSEWETMREVKNDT